MKKKIEHVPAEQAEGDSEAIEKPKKKITRRFEWTEKRREAWAKALETRKKNVQARKDEVVADYLKRNGTASVTKNESEEDGTLDSDSDSSYEVVVTAKRKPKPKPRQRNFDVEQTGDPDPTPTAFDFLWV